MNKFEWCSRLIAAAPDMYTALRKIADNYAGCQCDHATEDCCESPSSLDRGYCPHCVAELALAKAEAPNE